MLKLKFENKELTNGGGILADFDGDDVDQDQLGHAENEQKQFADNIHLITIAALKRYLSCDHATPSYGPDVYGTHTPTPSGSKTFVKHFQVYARVLHKALSFEQAAEQANRILSQGLPGHPTAWEEVKGLPRPEWIPEYKSYEKKMTESKSLTLAVRPN